jgi:DNA repair ATPase RecN
VFDFLEEQHKALRDEYENSRNNITQLASELDDYLRDAPVKSNELDYWRVNQTRFKHLYKLATKY